MATDEFYGQHPRATKLGLKPVGNGGSEHPGYDLEGVEKALGAKFPKLQGFLADKSVFVCGHRIVPREVTDSDGKVTVVQVEAYCIYAADLERFLEKEAANV